MPPGRYLHKRIPYIYRKMVDRATEHKRVIPFTCQEFACIVYKAIADQYCPYCLADLTFENFSADHMKPISRGGSWALDNIAIVCRMCNLEKSSGTLEWFLAKRRVRRGKAG